MIHVSQTSECSGCSACANICPHDAIRMNPDALGFLYPSVDKSKCTDCGLCEKVCAFNDHYDVSANLSSPIAYGCRHKDMSEVETSRSGAAFIAISDCILQNGGVIYGAGYSDHFRVVHKRATSKEERNEFKGSKYVQSDLNMVFRQVKKDLIDGVEVLFSGTPCQTAGLAAFIGNTKLKERLYLVDIICNGVPGPYLWRDYLAYLEEKQNTIICDVNFRDKQRFGWKAHRETFLFAGDSHRINFAWTFYNHTIMFRPSCGNCHYCNTKRPSDITLGDFWGWEKTDPQINLDNKGVSLVLINTEKGQVLFGNAKKDLVYFSAHLADCLQTHLRKPCTIDKRQKEFERDYIKHGFEHAMKKFGILGWKYHYKVYLKRIKHFLLGK